MLILCKKSLQLAKDLLVDTGGSLEKTHVAVSVAAKTFGAPFMIGEKYPAFKPVHKAISDSIDERNELWFLGAERLDPTFQRRLPEQSKLRLTQVVKLGSSLNKYYTPQELISNFNFNPTEIDAYTRLKRMYDFSTGLYVEKRKLEVGFDKMNPTQQTQFISDIKSSLRDGYINQQRIEGDWAVVVPPQNPGDPPQWFNQYAKKSEAMRVSASIPGSRMYRKTDKVFTDDIVKHMYLSDLERLIEAANVSTQSSDIQALRKVILSKSFRSHQIQRNNVTQGYDWNWDNIINSAIEYHEGASNSYTRIKGRLAADKAEIDNLSNMSDGLKLYTRHFIDGYYNTGAIGYKGMQTWFHVNALMLKPSYLAQNLTQTLTTTLPEMAKHFDGLGLEQSFAKNGLRTANIVMTLATKKRITGLTNQEMYIINKLHRQGYLGDQMARFELNVKGILENNFEQVNTLFSRMTEPYNRVLAALIAYDGAVGKEGLTDSKAIYEFVKNKVSRTQIRYDKANLPTFITGAGNMASFNRTFLYQFRSFSNNYLSLLSSWLRDKDAKQYARGLGSILLQAGIKGLPFAGLGFLGYKKLTGRTGQADVREAMMETKIPDKTIDMTLHGAYSYTGVDMSNMVGLGDITGINNSVLENVFGYPVGMAQQYSKAVQAAVTGNGMKALEYASPRFLGNAFKALRQAKEGIREMDGTFLYQPSNFETVLTALSFTPENISKLYESKDAKKTVEIARSQKNAMYNLALAKAYYDEDYTRAEKLINEVMKINEKADPSTMIIIDNSSVKMHLSEMLSGKANTSKYLYDKNEKIDRVFNVKSKE